MAEVIDTLKRKGLKILSLLVAAKPSNLINHCWVQTWGKPNVPTWLHKSEMTCFLLRLCDQWTICENLKSPKYSNKALAMLMHCSDSFARKIYVFWMDKTKGERKNALTDVSSSERWCGEYTVAREINVVCYNKSHRPNTESLLWVDQK